jgi:DNA-binding NarL/FixJ family response regulator
MRARGLTNGEAGCRMRCSEQTVKNHVQRVYEKLGVRNIVEACIAMGWLDIP